MPLNTGLAKWVNSPHDGFAIFWYIPDSPAKFMDKNIESVSIRLILQGPQVIANILNKQ